MADNKAIMRKLEEQDSLIRRLNMELNRLSKGKGIADDGASGGAISIALEDEEIYVELGVVIILRYQAKGDKDVRKMLPNLCSYRLDRKSVV